jgi:hypothetical protein
VTPQIQTDDADLSEEWMWWKRLFSPKKSEQLEEVAVTPQIQTGIQENSPGNIHPLIKRISKKG